MTDEQRALCMKLLYDHLGVRRISEDEFLRRFPTAVENGRLSLRLLDDAFKARSGEDLQCAMLVGFTFGFGAEHVDILSKLVDADWHLKHEDVVWALDQLRTPAAADALFRATQWIPAHLDYDDSRVLASKAIWGLGNLPGAKTEAMLVTLSQSTDPLLQEYAKEQLERRHTEPPQE